MTMSMSNGNNKYFQYDNEDLLIDKENSDVVYNDAKHIYVGKNGETKDKKYISVTTLIGLYENKFDGDFWSKYKALEALIPDNFDNIKPLLLETKKWSDSYLNDLNVTKEQLEAKVKEIKSEWKNKNKEACEHGTRVHAKQEQGFYSNADKMIEKFNLGGKIPVFKNHQSLDMESGIIPEMLLTYQSSDGLLRIAGQSDLIIKEGNKIKVWDYKGLPLYTKIPTPKGWITMKDLKEGDEVFDKNGNITKVIHKSEVHHNPCYKITFDNSESIIADKDHRWEVSFKLGKNKWENEIMTTEDLKDHLEYIEKIRQEKGKVDSKLLPKIRNTKPLNLPNQWLPIDPYVFGAWLGDGSKSCGIITNINPDFWQEVKNRGYEISENLSKENRAEMHTVYGIRTYLDELGVLNNKHIPDIYLFASYEQRLDLLRGLMDTDGYYHKERKRFVMQTGQIWQAKDTLKLISSLGLKGTIFKTKAHCDGKTFDAWSICFSTKGLNPFLVRNQNINFPSTDKCSFRVIKSVEVIEEVPTQCIEVDSPTHTYLCTESMIVTHNTNKELKQKSYFNPKTKTYEMMKFPLNKIMDCNFWHYTLQLSLYAWMIQKSHPELLIDELRIIHFTHDGQCNEYVLDYLKDDVIRMLKHYKRQATLKDIEERNKPIIF